MNDSEEEEYKIEIIRHNGKDFHNFDYEKKMQLEDIFRLNHLDSIQDIYDEFRDFFQEKGIELHDFIDFCLENSYVEEEIINNDIL